MSYRRALILTHRRYRAATAAPRAHAREAKGADAPARRLRAALMSHHQGSRMSCAGWRLKVNVTDCQLGNWRGYWFFGYPGIASFILAPGLSALMVSVDRFQVAGA
jgi:hypothetical protein